MIFAFISEAELDAILDAPYNGPSFMDSFSRDDFSDEYWGYHARLVKRLYLLGRCSNFFENGRCCLTDFYDFTMNEGFGDSRCFDIELNDVRMFRSELLPLVQQTLATFDVPYQVTVHHDLLDYEPFYFVVTRESTKAWPDGCDALLRRTQSA